MNTGLLTWCQSFGVHVVFSDMTMMSERAPVTSSMFTCACALPPSSPSHLLSFAF